MESKFKIGDEEWTAKYKPMVTHQGRYVKAARVPSKKEILLSLKTQDGKNFSTEELTANFQKAILPYVLNWAKDKYGEEEVEQAINELQGK